MTTEPLRFGSSDNAVRTEDAALVTGQGRFTDDIRKDGETYAAFLRADIAHGEINSINRDAAAQMPGVLAVVTGKDLAAEGIGAFPPLVLLPGRDGEPMFGPAMPVLAVDRVRHVGEPLAVAVAVSEAAALDAVEAMTAEITELPAAPTVAAALKPGATQIWPEAPDNISLDWVYGDEDAVSAAFDAAAHVSTVRLMDTRVAPTSIEPRAAIGEWEEASGRYTLTASTQGVAVTKKLLAENVLNVPADKVRVLTYDVGGGFGMKAQVYPEYAALLIAAKRVGRPVRWCATRLESFLGDTHGRDGELEGELALDKDGAFLALRVKTAVGIGAYASMYSAIVATNNTKNCLSSVYKIPAIHINAKMVLSTAVMLGPYRGAGRPEALYMIERLIDKAARETGVDRVELRRRNMIPPSAMPYQAPNSPIYDSGEFEAVLDKALALADWEGFSARKAAAAKAGKLRGIGLACFLEVAGGAPLTETADLRFENGKAVLRTGAQVMGQGQMTVMPRIVAGQLGIAPEDVAVIQGDSDEVPDGLPTVASRSTMMAGGAISLACEEAIEKGMALAADHLEAAQGDLEYADGGFRIKGTDRSVSLLALSETAGDELDTVSIFAAEQMSFPNGCHVTEVEIDPETGKLQIVGYAAVDDVGNILHETIVEGQIHGGVAQGLGQVLGEEIVYTENGQMQTASLMDYMVPRADDLPAMDLGHHVAVCTTNPLGVKGSGESGVAGSLPSAVNAVLDALADHGVEHLDMPMSAPRIWAALNGK